MLKVPLLWVMKGSCLVLGVPSNRLTCMQGQKTLLLSYKKHLFLPYLLNDSQTIRSTVHFSKALLCVTLICCDWSHRHLVSPVMPDKAVFVSAVLLCVQRYRGNRYFYEFEWICIFIQTNAKRPKSARQYANVSCWLHMKRLGFVLKTPRFNDSESTLSFERL